MELFHGCRQVDPLSICNSQEGFDVRHSRVGRCGSAKFASTAQYADKFAHVTTNDQKEILIAKVILGEVYNCGTSKDETANSTHKVST